MAWSVVQQFKSAGGASPQAATPSQAYTAGTKLIALLSINDQGGPGTITVHDANSNNFTLILHQNLVSVGAGDMYLYVLDMPAGTVGTSGAITATNTGPDNQTLEVLEVSGLATGTTASIDGTTVGTSGTASPGITAAYSTTASSEFLVVLIGATNATTYTTPAGYTASTANSGGGSNGNPSVFYKNSTGGAESASITLGGTVSEWGTIFCAFKLGVTGTSYPALLPVMRRGRNIKRGRKHPPQQIVWYNQTGSAPVQNTLTLATSVTASATMSVRISPILSVAATASASVLRFVRLHVLGQALAVPAVQRAISTSIKGLATGQAFLLRQPQPVLRGQATASGTMTTIKIKLVTLAGSVTVSATQKIRISKQVAGQATAAPALVRALSSHLSGLATASGSQRIQARPILATQATAVPSLVRKISSKFAGLATASGTLVTRKVNLLTLAGSVTAVPSVARALSFHVVGLVTAAPSLAKRIAISVTLSSSATATGKLAVRVGTRVATAATVTATVSVRIAVRYLTTVTATGALATLKTRLMVLPVTATASATLVRRIGKQAQAQVTANASQNVRISKGLAAQVTAVPLLAKGLRARLVAAVTATPTLFKRIPKLLFKAITAIPFIDTSVEVGLLPPVIDCDIAVVGQLASEVSTANTLGSDVSVIGKLSSEVTVE